MSVVGHRVIPLRAALGRFQTEADIEAYQQVD
jgi:hypothetical protein